MADRSRSPSRASASPSQGHLPSVAPPPHKSRSKSRASATKSKSSTSLQTSAAAERDASRRQQALDRQFDKAKQKLAEEGRETSVPLTEDSPLLNQPGWSPTIPSGSGEDQETICTVFGDSSRSMPEPPHQAPSATFTPTAAGVSYREDSIPAIPQDIRHLIMQTISQGIDNGFTQRGFPAPFPSGSSDQRLHSDSHPPRLRALRTRSPTPSHHSEDSFLREEDIAEYNLSEDEKSAPDKPAPTGLFRHELFYTLLQKAKVTANKVTALHQSEGASDPSDPNKFLFTEPVSEQRVIPSPKLFLDTIQRQWGHPGAIPIPSGSDKKMYTTDQDLEDLLKVPTVDTPIATLASSSNIIPSDAAEGLRTEDRRAELSTRKTHQAASWAIRSATAASFFARTSLIWLRQMQERIPQDDSRLHQDINKLVTAAEYTVDATLNSAKFASRALASSITSRRLLWLRQWQADMKTKWRLAAAPFKGGSLFGEALDPILVEGKDKRKILPYVSRHSDRRPSLPYRRQPFRTQDPVFQSPAYQRAFQPPPDRFQDRQSFRDRTRQSQTRRPSRGSGFRPYRRNK
ncbi:uncharacterized protein LOC131191317 [Ahaetulla prasina]|uniref:uncharacterized protein LOC131191317 n=1 Tax=Ahaetulla prasina TaxID=499056 RepID=UPI00264A39D5|nr:uncharacterized protein LOC131191317 [Ahaetulla prasina]